MHLSFHGAAQGVTGSCHLIECAGKKILIDCGMFQGGPEQEAFNRAPFGFSPADIDFVLLTHAHLDHCGRLPMLYKQGFRGEIICTSATRELAKLVLLDSAHLQEEEARYQQRRALKRGKTYDVPALYGVLDTLNTFDALGRCAAYGTPLDLAPGIQAVFYDAGHILGSASVLLILKEGLGPAKRVLFSGDLGSGDGPLLSPPVPPSACDLVVMETTYGDRLHKALQPSIQELYQAVQHAFERGGNVIIPTFALERTQELLFYLREGFESRQLPRSAHVFVDSPMAISATEIFRSHLSNLSPKVQALCDRGVDPFNMPNLHLSRETADSIALNRVRSGAIIMAGSGMCNGGRIRHHLKQNIWREECSIVFVGYAAKGTLARNIIDGAKHVHIFGDEIPVRATVHTINGFSAHADQNDLVQWHRATGQPAHTYLVHGEPMPMEKFKALLNHTAVHMPERDTRIEL